MVTCTWSVSLQPNTDETITRYQPVSVTEKPGMLGLADDDEKPDGGILLHPYVTDGESTTDVSNNVLAAPRHSGELLDAHTFGLCRMVTIHCAVSGRPLTVFMTDQMPA